MKTVLIITYYWPPSGGSGVQRWLKFTSYLGSFGWHPIILTPENPQFSSHDPSLENEVHPDTEVLKLPIWEPYHLVSKNQLKQGSTSTSTSSWMKFVRGNLILPDPRIFWKRPAVRFLKEYLKTRHVDAIITTGPPHSMHLIGKRIHKKLGIPWVVDFRDPWSTWDMLDEFHTGALARGYHRRLEKGVVKTADAVITVSPAWAKELSDRYRAPVEVITNGYDPVDFQNTEPSRPEKFRLMHFGLINEFRHVPALWEALAEVREKNPAMEDMLEVQLYGVMDDQLKRWFLEECPVKSCVKLHEPVSHEKVLELYCEAAVLLLFMNKSENAAGHIPGKLFEYLAAERPILALGDPRGDTAGIIRQCQAGEVVLWDDKTRLLETITNMFENYLSTARVPSDNAARAAYSRVQLTGKLAGVLDKITAHGPVQ